MSSSDQSSSQERSESSGHNYRSDDEGELNIDFKALFFGEALSGVEDDGEMGLDIVRQEIALENIFADRETQPEKPPQQRLQESSDSCEEVETDLKVLYKVKYGKNSPRERVFCFTEMYMPDNARRRQQMVDFNRQIIDPFPEHANESIRARKRLLKENYKQCMRTHLQKAKFLPINQFLEDAYFLHGYSKQGLEQTSKKNQWLPGYKVIGGPNQHQTLPPQVARILPRKRQIHAINPHQKVTTARDILQNLQEQNGIQNYAFEAMQEQDRFKLEACQINELMGDLKGKNELSNEENAAANTSISIIDKSEQKEQDQLRLKLRICKQKLQQKLAQEFPVPAFNPIDKQCFSFLRDVQLALQNEPPRKPQNLSEALGIVSDFQMQEWVTNQKFKMLGIVHKRKKYWGEPKDCSSQFQVQKDAYECRHEEWLLHKQGKLTRSRPFFAIKFEQKVDSKSEVKELPNAKSKIIEVIKPQQLINPNTLDASGIVGCSYKSAQHALVDNFQEYEILKERESKIYNQALTKKQVSAKSIMRHVRWKLGKITDKQFFEEEYNESVTQRARNNIDNNSERANAGQDKKEFLEENLDAHFERKRIELQAEILRKKEKKEKASQQNVRPSTTTAYEPIQLSKSVLDKNDSDNEVKRPNDKLPSDQDSASESSSSESDEDDDMHEKQKRRFHNRVTPSRRDELNHAKCIKDLSFYKLNWSDEDLMTFHRPNIHRTFTNLQDQQREPAVKCAAVVEKGDEIKNKLNPEDYFKDRFKLSLNKGKFCVFEHIDQHPLLVNNFGMASRLRRYYYSDKQPSKKVFYQKHENKGSRHIGPYGELLLKGQCDKLELLGQVDLNHFKGLAVLENKMYNAPVFFHQPATTDFFCSLIKKKNGEFSVAIREMDSLYTVGQIEPKLEVYNPQSRYFQNFIKSRSKAYIIRFLQESKTIHFYDIVRFFPHIGEPILKKGLKEIEVEIDRNGLCQFNENFEEEKFKDRMTPEMICQYESAREGQYRLQKLGVTEILSADKISYSTNKFILEETDMTLKRIAKLIESEVLSTPWNLSSNYIKIKQEGSMMMLKGQGDPSFGRGGYSFLKMPLKISQDSLQGARQNRMNLNPAIQNPKAVTGTEADLRKLQKEQIFQKLQKMGIAEEELVKKSRWQMVALLRYYAPENEENRQFQRGMRFTAKEQLEKYSQQAKENFLLQMQNLSDHNPKKNIPQYIHEHSEEEPDFVIEKDEMESVIIRSKRRERSKGRNATDFKKEILESMSEESRRIVVEMKEEIEIKRIEDIKDYLKLLLVAIPINTLKPQNPSGINVGGVKDNLELSEALNGSGQKDLERQLLEKIKNGEVTKQCEILCKKIRSLTDADQNQNLNGKPIYQRIIFCSDEKTIKKFRRSKNKNSQKPQRNKKLRNQQRGQRPALLTKERLGSTSQRSGSLSSSAVRTERRDGRKDSESLYSQSVSQGFHAPGSITITNSQLKPNRSRYRNAFNDPVINVKLSDTYKETNYKSPVSYQSGTIRFALPKQSRAKNRQGRVTNPEGRYVDDNYNVEEYDMASDDDFSQGSDFHPDSSQHRRRLSRFAEPARQSQRQSKSVLQKKKTVSSQSRFKSLGFGKEDFDYQVQPGMNNKSQRKRQQACDQALNQIFMEILEEMWDMDRHGIYHNQVTKQDAPTYKDVIKNPIALKDMKNRCKRNEYKNREQFIADANLMYQNASFFNGREHSIAMFGQQLLELCIKRCRDRNGEIINLETLVQTNML